MISNAARVSAFGDDALGALDATAVAEALRSGAVSRVEVVDAAIARTQLVNPRLNGLAYEAFDRARTRAAAPTRYGGFFDGVPTFVKDNVAVEGMPTMEGTDAWRPRPETSNGEFARTYLSTGLIALGKTQMSEFGFSAVAEHPRLGAVRNPGTPTTPPVRRRRDPARSSRRASSRSRMPTTAEVRFGFRRRATGWSDSSPRAAGCPLTRTCARCRSASWPMEW